MASRGDLPGFEDAGGEETSGMSVWSLVGGLYTIEDRARDLHGAVRGDGNWILVGVH